LVLRSSTVTDPSGVRRPARPNPVML